MYCNHCGRKIAEDAFFCSNCGTPVDRQGLLNPDSDDLFEETMIFTEEEAKEVRAQSEAFENGNAPFEPEKARTPEGEIRPAWLDEEDNPAIYENLTDPEDSAPKPEEKVVATGGTLLGFFKNLRNKDKGPEEPVVNPRKPNNVPGVWPDKPREGILTEEPKTNLDPEDVPGVWTGEPKKPFFKGKTPKNDPPGSKEKKEGGFFRRKEPVAPVAPPPGTTEPKDAPGAWAGKLKGSFSKGKSKGDKAPVLGQDKKMDNTFVLMYAAVVVIGLIIGVVLGLFILRPWQGDEEEIATPPAAVVQIAPMGDGTPGI